MNVFFLRFESSLEKMADLDSIICNSDQRLKVAPHIVCSIFKGVCTKKSTSPDGISAFLLKSCANELTPAFCPIFQRSLDLHSIPSLRKKKNPVITPVPKKNCTAENCAFRPVALPSYHEMFWKISSKCSKRGG